MATSGIGAKRGATGTHSAEDWAGPSTGAAAALFFALSFVYFVPALLPNQQIYGTDYLGGGYFFYHFIAERLSSLQLPKWVPYIFGGMPLFANPGSTFHPVHLLASVLLPVDKVLATVFWVHFGLAGLGMFLLARELGCRRWVALLAGLAFQFTGITTSWVYAGHDGRIIVATLAPLLFFFLHRGVRTTALAPFVGAAATIGVALLSFQIQNCYYLLLAAAVWAVFCLFHLRVTRKPRVLGLTLALGLGAVAFGFAMAAVNFLPFLGYVPESPRGQEGGRGYDYSISFSMPPAEVLSLAVPEQAGASVGDPTTGEPRFPEYRGSNPFKLHTEYVGALVMLLLALGGYYSRRERYWWFFAGLGLLFLSIALGGNTPLYRLYYELLPGTKRFRAPSLAFIVVAFSLVVMAALTLERLARLRAAGAPRGATREAGQRLDRVAWIVGGTVLLALLGAATLGGGDPAAAGGPSRSLGWVRFALFAGLSGGVLWAWLQGKMTTVATVAVLGLVTLTDLWSIGRRFFYTVPPAEEMFASDDVIDFLRQQPGPNRVWTFPYPQAYRGAGPNGGNFPMLYEIQQAGGEHPVPLQRWNEYLGAGTETMIDWHNFITRAEVVDGPAGQAVAFQSVPGFLEAANIRYIVSLAPLAHPALREVHRGASALVYEHRGALARAYLVPQVVEVPDTGAIAAMTARTWDPRQVAFVPRGAGVSLPSGPLAGEASVSEYGTDRVTVRARANRPALLVLADNFYDGWTVQIDDAPARLLRVNHTMRGVVVPAGDHTVRFEFHPDGLFAGFYVYLATMALLIGYAAFLLLRWRRRAEPAA